MGDFLQSKVYEDFKNGKLPPVEVQFEAETLVTLMAGLFLVGLALIISWNIFQKLN